MKVVKRGGRIAAAGGTAVFVVHDHEDAVRSVLLDGLDVPFPIVLDTDRDCYDRWGMQRAPWWRIWLDPHVWKQYAHFLSGGDRIRGAGVDTRQLGGDFVVGPDGRLVYSRPQRRDDRPPVGELIEQLEASVG